MEKKSQFQAGLSDSCIFIGGQPRSGTTLLSSILRNTPNHFQAFELHIRKPSFVVGLNGNYTRNILKELGLPPKEFDKILTQSDTSRMNLGAWVGEKEDVSAELNTGKETDRIEEELAARGKLVTCLMRRVTEIHGKRTWGFKIIGDIALADHYSRVWPHAIFLHMIRDPRDQALSLLKLNEHRTLRGQQPFYSDYSTAAIGWRRTIEVARAVAKANHLTYFEVKYEDLASRPEKEMERLTGLLNIDLSRGLEFYHQDFIKKHTKRFKHLDNLQKPISTRSVGKWREVFSDEINGVFWGVAGDLMQSLGYSQT